MLVFVYMLEEVGVHRVGIDARERDDEVRREPALGLDGEHRRKHSLDIFKNRERNHSLEEVHFIADDDALLDKAEAMQRRLFRGMERKRSSRDDDESCEQIITE